MTMYRGWITVRPVVPVNKAHYQFMEVSRVNIESGDNILAKVIAAWTPVFKNIMEITGMDVQPIWLGVQVIVCCDGKTREGYIRASAEQVEDPDTELRIPNISITWSK
jgi:hypothetical protein